MAMLAAVALAGVGCGGINASQSVSPASFLLPGILKNDVACTNSASLVLMEKPADISPNLASVR